MPKIIPKNVRYTLCNTGMKYPTDLEILPNRFYLYSIDGNLEYAVCNQKREIIRTKINLKEFDDSCVKEIKSGVEKGHLDYPNEMKLCQWATNKGYPFKSPLSPPLRYSNMPLLSLNKTKAIEVYENRQGMNQTLRNFDIRELLDLRQIVAKLKGKNHEDVTEQEIEENYNNISMEIKTL